MHLKQITGIAAVFVVSSVVLFFAAFHEAKKTAIDELNARQMSQARQAKNAIEQHMHHYNVILEFLSRNPDVAFMNERGRETVKLVFRYGHEDIKSVTRVDRYGRILFADPNIPEVIGKDISYQKHMKEILVTRKPAISDIFRTVQGYDAIVIHYPVFLQGEFDGTIGIVFSIDGLAEKFIKDIKIGKDGYSWVISRDGTELWCSVPGHTGKSVFVNAADSPEVLAMTKRMMKGEEGTAEYTYNFIRETRSDHILKHAVFVPVKVGDTFWSIVVATPESEVLMNMRAFTLRMLMIAVVLATGFIFVMYIIFKSWKEAKNSELQLKKEEIVRESEKRFRLVIEQTGLLVYDYDTASSVVKWEGAISDMTGFDPSVFLDASAVKWKEMIHPEDIDTTGWYNGWDPEKSESYSREYRLRRKNGSYIFIEDNGIYIYNMEGNPPRILGTIKNISDRKKAVETLKESEEKFHKTFDNSPAGIIIIRLDTVRFIEANDAYLAQTGYTRSELIGRSGIEIGLWPDQDGFENILKMLKTGGTPRNIEISQKTKDGESRIMLVSAVPVQISNAESAVIVFLDITEKHLLEIESLKAHKLESIGVLAGGIAHDFNNLLTGILANISLVKMTRTSGDSDYQWLESAEKASLRARDLTQQLLTFSKGGLPVKSSVPIRELVQEASTFSMHGSKSRLVFNFDENIKNVWADSGQISQVVNNLVINASHAMEEVSGGIIKIGIHNRSIEGKNDIINPGEYVEITVEDSGSGISPEVLPKIFDPYYTTKKTGSGLGLAVVYSIIKNHDGRIFVDSEPGKGAKFTILLPAADEELLKDKHEAEKIRPGSARILIVDDEKAVSDASCAILQMFGYDTAVAYNGRDAISIYAEAMNESRRFDVVIMDLTMPGSIGGKETTNQLLKIDPEAAIIVSSGYSTDPVMSDFVSYGFSGAVEKPYRADTLLSVVQQCIKKK